jgi:hypothetical protein
MAFGALFKRIVGGLLPNNRPSPLQLDAAGNLKVTGIASSEASDGLNSPITTVAGAEQQLLPALPTRMNFFIQVISGRAIYIKPVTASQAGPIADITTDYRVRVGEFMTIDALAHFEWRVVDDGAACEIRIMEARE